MLLNILPNLPVLDTGHSRRGNSILSTYICILTGVCSYGSDFIRSHLSGFGSTPLIRSGFSDIPLSLPRNMLPSSSALDVSYNCCTDPIRLRNVWMRSRVFQYFRHKIISQFGRWIVRSLWRIGVCFVAPFLHHVLSVVFVRTFKDMARIIAKPFVTTMARKHAFRHFSSVKGFPCDAMGSSGRTIPAISGYRAISLLGISSPEPTFIRSSDVSLEPDLTRFRAVTSLLSRERLVAVKTKAYVSGSHSATPVQSGFGQVCHGMPPVTGRFFGVKPIWHPAALSSRVKFTTGSLGMREQPYPIPCPPPGGGLRGVFLSCLLSFSLSAFG
jgi:hypothetical protein